MVQCQKENSKDAKITSLEIMVTKATNFIILS